jgi:hypothetical protein
MNHNISADVLKAYPASDLQRRSNEQWSGGRLIAVATFYCLKLYKAAGSECEGEFRARSPQACYEMAHESMTRQALFLHMREPHVVDLNPPADAV